MNRSSRSIALAFVAAVLCAFAASPASSVSPVARAAPAAPAAPASTESSAARGDGDVFHPMDLAHFAYHIRVVRIVGPSDYHGAALGCGKTCGLPIVVPAEEAWGTPAQLAGLAHALGGERADAVTGFIVVPGPDGAAGFEGTVYPGAAAVGISFSARTPQTPDEPHDLHLTITPTDGGNALAEARVLSASDRTVAIALPSPVDGEWLVVAVTALDGRAALARVMNGAPLDSIKGAVTPPQLIESVAPKYTEQARKDRRQGKVFIAAVIDASGAVRAPMVMQVGSGLEELAAGAVEAVAKWRYRPATLDGQPIAVEFTIMVEYVLT